MVKLVDLLPVFDLSKIKTVKKLKRLDKCLKTLIDIYPVKRDNETYLCHVIGVDLKEHDATLSEVHMLLRLIEKTLSVKHLSNLAVAQGKKLSKAARESCEYLIDSNGVSAFVAIAYIIHKRDSGGIADVVSRWEHENASGHDFCDAMKTKQGPNDLRIMWLKKLRKQVKNQIETLGLEENIR